MHTLHCEVGSVPIPTQSIMSSSTIPPPTRMTTNVILDLDTLATWSTSLDTAQHLTAHSTSLHATPHLPARPPNDDRVYQAQHHGNAEPIEPRIRHSRYQDRGQHRRVHALERLVRAERRERVDLYGKSVSCLLGLTPHKADSAQILHDQRTFTINNTLFTVRPNTVLLIHRLRLNGDDGLGYGPPSSAS